MRPPRSERGSKEGTPERQPSLLLSPWTPFRFNFAGRQPADTTSAHLLAGTLMYDTVHRAPDARNFGRFARDRIVFRPVNALQSNAFVFFLSAPLTVFSWLRRERLKPRGKRVEMKCCFLWFNGLEFLQV